MKRRGGFQENSNCKAKRKSFERTKSSILLWSNDDVANWLVDVGLERFQTCFAGLNVAGKDLLTFTEEQLNNDIDDFDIDESDLQELWGAILKLRDEDEVVPDIDYSVERKVVQDAIHGSIELHPLLVTIIDTPEFQRLRNIKQLGCCSLIYPSACHHRFEHSIGVCHLAGKLLRKLKTNQPELDISERDILCVEVAGLCHDLGHGPFSHMFDGRFLPAARPGYASRHEDQSVRMFDHLLESNTEVKEAFKHYTLYNETDLNFIKEQIAGPQGSDSYKSRGADKAFLYEVVANKQNGIDVDKWDYFARDSYFLGFSSSFDHVRLMNFVRVLKVNGRLQICTRDKEAETLYEMFNTRRSLHKKAYKHRVCGAIEIMLCEAFRKADKYLKFYNKANRDFSLSQCVDDCEAFTSCTDHVFYQILHSRDSNLQAAREIIEKIQRRDLYKCVGETRPKQGVVLQKKDLPGMQEKIASSLSTDQLEGSQPLKADDIVLNIVGLDYGMGQEDPIENVWFYMKGNPSTAIRRTKHEVSSMLPDTFSEQILVAYCKRTDPESMEVAQKCFMEWCDTQNMFPPKGWKDSGLELSTTSNEACRLLDAALKQLTAREVGEHGTLDEILEAMLAADPEFVLGHVIIFDFMLASLEKNKEDKTVLERRRHLEGLVEKQSSRLSRWERQHADAAMYIANGMLNEGRLEWISILAEHPRDMLALKMVYGWQIFTGCFEEMRDVMSRVLPSWRPSDPEYGYLLGMYAFALQETHFYEKGKQKGLEALTINSHDTWATHTMAHVYLMTGCNDTGAQFMADTIANWEWDDSLSCHNHWHNALFYVEKGDFKTALDIYDQEVAKRVRADSNAFRISDGVSLLYRFQLEGVDPGPERWREMAAVSEPHIGDHASGLYDAHYMIAACSSHKKDMSAKMLESMKNMIKGEKHFVAKMTEEVNLPFCEAIAAYERRDYETAVEYLQPVRYKTAPMGGSAAQRDIFNQLLIHSALKSPRRDHVMLAQQLLLERKAFRKNSPLVDRLMYRTLSSHTD